MFEFTKIAYIITVPVLLVISMAGPLVWKKNSIRLLAVTNLLLIGNSIFLIRQFYGFYQLGQSLGIHYKYGSDMDLGLLIRLLLIILLPFFSLHRFLRADPWFSALLVVLLYSFYPLRTWSQYDLLYKIMTYLCLLCIVYALLWLWKKLPYQSS